MSRGERNGNSGPWQRCVRRPSIVTASTRMSERPVRRRATGVSATSSP